MKKILSLFFILLFSLVLVGCNEITQQSNVTTIQMTENDSNSTTEEIGNEVDDRIYQIYQLAVDANATFDSYEDWLESVRGPEGEPGKSIALRVADSNIQWQYTGDETWTNLIDINTLTGANGKDGVDGTNGVDGTDGTDGREVSFQVSEGYIQWQYTGDETWTNLIDLNILTGANGADGIDGTDGREVSFQVSEGYIQWKYTGDETWTNLVDLTTIVNVTGIENSISDLQNRIEALEAEINSYDLQNQVSTIIENVYESVVGVKTYSEGEYVSLGSGFIYKQVDNVYYVVTNYHVVEGGDIFGIYLFDNSIKDATLVGYDFYSDLAVLTFETTDVYPISEIADSNLVNRGDFVIAIGSPLELLYYNSVTFGMVSGTKRGLSGSSDEEYFGELFIQHDAAVNPGNSGGPLFNTEGQVIGINTMKMIGEMIDTMGYAIPSNSVSTVLSIIETGEMYKRAGLWYGSVINVNYIRNNPSDYPGITIPNNILNGVYIEEPSADGIFGLASIQDGDIILSVDGNQVDFWYELKHYIYYQNTMNDNITFEVYRNGSVMTLTYDPLTYLNGYYWYEILHFTDGDTYVGEIYNGYMHGFGTYNFIEGSYYIGEFDQDYFSGYGEMYFTNGDYFIGNWLDDIPSGEGTYYFANGDYLVANWIDWNNTTEGIYYYADGTTDYYNYVDGVLVSY